ncbi:copper homeostasis membrane protein CopD [Enterobacteriaceae bacterium YMB-R22]|uniref:copper homeostasis membrane protein CopD n=1 Tax=Tenebrionicola larvae TaxID=2815733 RepID=UPI002012D41A|nr:copper homeostasis membrane protein CopD [Tenebrionicola larvae]MBV4411579.1 copper homeostasis membrane protein CopD [Tenebrionicola larvae]
MLDAAFVCLRFVHFLALMLLAGAAVCSEWLARGDFRAVMARRLAWLWLPSGMINAVAVLLIVALQAGLMGQGWGDVFNPAVWLAVLGTRFGAVWLWQIMLSAITLTAVALRPYRLQPLLICLAAVQLIMLAGTGHATMHEGVTGLLHRLNHSLHLLSVAWWIGGLPPLLICMRMAHKQRWREAATGAMMRYSRYGHIAVALAVITGIVNSLFILGWRWPWHSGYVHLLLVKIALVAAMIGIALVNRYVLVSRFTRDGFRAQRTFVMLTQLEVALALLALAGVSLFATLQPF